MIGRAANGGCKECPVGPWDEMDEEVLAIRRNAALMAHINMLFERARQGPRKSLAEIKAKYGIEVGAKRRQEKH